MWREKRSSTRHIIRLPIRYRQVGTHKVPQHASLTSIDQSQTKNLSEGGLLFLSSELYPVGATLELAFPMKGKVFTMRARVVHSVPDAASGLHETGVCFANPTQVFKIKMAEQLFQIEQYRESLTKKQGKRVSEEEAAQKWIGEHSREFAAFYQTGFFG